MAEEKKSMFHEILERNNAKIRGDRAKRIADSVKEAQVDKVRNLESQVRKVTDELDRMMDLSTDNSSFTVNRVLDLDGTEFVNALHNHNITLTELDIELSIAKKTLKEYFS